MSEELKMWFQDYMCKNCDIHDQIACKNQGLSCGFDELQQLKSKAIEEGRRLEREEIMNTCLVYSRIEEGMIETRVKIVTGELKEKSRALSTRIQNACEKLHTLIIKQKLINKNR